MIDGLYDLTPTKFGRVDNYITSAGNFGKQIDHWQGVDVILNARLRAGLTVQGGTSTGRRVTDNCEVIVDSPGRRNCHVALPFQTEFRGLASYQIPKVDVLVSGTFQSTVGAQLQANWNVPNAVVAQTLGRPLSGGAANVSVNLLNPGQLYGDRINQFDLRVAKTFRFAGKRLNVGTDLYNVLNRAPVLTYNQTFGSSVADADVGAESAVRPVQHSIRLLTANSNGPVRVEDPMTRSHGCGAFLACTLSLLALVVPAISAQVGRDGGGSKGAPSSRAAKPWTPPRTPWGDPDIQGTFTNVAMRDVPFERAVELGERSTITDAEFAERLARDEQARRRSLEERVTPTAPVFRGGEQVLLRPHPLGRAWKRTQPANVAGHRSAQRPDPSADPGGTAPRARGGAAQHGARPVGRSRGPRPVRPLHHPRPARVR